VVDERRQQAIAHLQEVNTQFTATLAALQTTTQRSDQPRAIARQLTQLNTLTREMRGLIREMLQAIRETRQGKDEQGAQLDPPTRPMEEV